MKKCKKHPKYKGSKIPSNGCSECFNYYMSLYKGRSRLPPLPRNKVVKDKTKYNRKKKFKNEYNY